MMYRHEKSDLVIVAMKPANKAKKAHCGGVCGGGSSGVGGAKGGGQGEYAPAQHVLDPEPGSRDKRAGCGGRAMKRTSLPLQRREFITLLGGAAAAWPLAARAQQRTMPVIGALHAASRAGTGQLMAAYFEGLKSEGYVEAQNVMVEYRWADGVFGRIPEMMAELVRLQPDVITAFGTATRAAYNARLAGMAGNIPLCVFARLRPDCFRSRNQCQSSRQQYHGCDQSRRRPCCQARGIPP